MTYKTIIIRAFPIAIILVSILSFSLFRDIQNIDSAHLITNQKKFTAGSIIQLQFISNGGSAPALGVKSSYGSTLFYPEKKKDTLTYTFPDFLTKKTGIINWYLTDLEETITGDIQIVSDPKETFLESYFGPRTILAGRNDFSMLVVVPTDNYDNPLKDSTNVTIKYEFQSYVTKTAIATDNFISWKNIFSRDLAGDILVSSSCNGTDSKEFLTEVYPSNATDFTITAKRDHKFADGNQITTFKTSVIKDQYDNIVADGTFVEFFIYTENNIILKTSGSTVLGIATAKMLHPDYETSWNIKAFVTGLAKSDTISLSYEAVMTNFDVALSENGRTLTIGPLKSFMEQLMPDGAVVYLRVFDRNNNLIEIKKDTSFEGYVTFYLSPDFYPENTYHFDIETSGIHKKAPNIHLW